MGKINEQIVAESGQSRILEISTASDNRRRRSDLILREVLAANVGSV